MTKIISLLFSFTLLACGGAEFQGTELTEAGGAGGDDGLPSAGSGGKGSSASSASSGAGGSTGGSAGAPQGGTSATGGGAGSTGGSAGSAGAGGAPVELCAAPDVLAGLPTTITLEGWSVEADGHCAHALTTITCTLEWSDPQIVDTTVRAELYSASCGDAVQFAHGLCGEEALSCIGGIGGNPATHPVIVFDVVASPSGFDTTEATELGFEAGSGIMNDFIGLTAAGGQCSSGTPTTGPSGWPSKPSYDLNQRLRAALKSAEFPCAE